MLFRLPIRLVVVTTILLVATSVAHAQQGEDLREAAQNPIADLISLPFQNNTNFDIGHTDNTQHSAGLSDPPQSQLESDHPPDPAGDRPTALSFGTRASCG
jgi:hypothetical protein